MLLTDSNYNVFMKHPTQNCIIIRNAYSYDFGGGEKFPVSLAKQLMKNGINPLIVSRSQKLLDNAQKLQVRNIKGWWWSRQDWSGLSFFLLPIYFMWQIILVAWYIRLIIKENADVIHPQSRDDFIAATLAGIILRKRIVWTDHADLKYIYKNVRVWYKNPIGKTIYLLSKYSHAVTLVSVSEGKQIERVIGKQLPSNYIVIHNGISSNKIIPTKRSPKEKSIIFASTSRLVVAKGIGELIQSFNILYTTNKNVRLKIFGEGPDENIFREMAKNSPQIEFCGYPENTLSQLASCDVFVHPSYHEGFSLSIIEATKIGLPIVACNVGGNTEIIENNVTGLLIPPRNINALTQVLSLLAQDEKLRYKLGIAAHNRYLKEFVLEKIVKERFIPLYE